MEDSGDKTKINNMRHLIKLFEARANQLDDDEAHDFEDGNHETDALSTASTGTFIQCICKFWWEFIL